MKKMIYPILMGFSIMGFSQEENTPQKKDSIHQMDEVIVSTAFYKLQSQNVMKVEHVKINSLQQKGAITLSEGLSKIPGVSVITTGTSIGKPVIRGLSGNRVLVYAQGVRLENQQFGEEHGLGLNDSGVDSFEVIKGPASLLYGSDALGGVLYFNPEKFAPTKSDAFSFKNTYFTNTSGNNTALGYKVSGENIQFSSNISYSSHADYKVAKGDRVTNTRFNELDIKTGLGYSKNNFSTVFRYNVNQLNLGIPENGIASQTQSHKPDYPRQKVNSQILSLNSVYKFTHSKIEADLGYIDNQRSEFEDRPTALLKMKLKTSNFNIKYYLPKKGKLETIVGSQGMNQTNTNFGEELLIPDATTTDMGFFTTSYYTWNKNSVQAGIRWDNRKIESQTAGEVGSEGYFEAINRNFNSINASLGYKTQLKENLIVRLNLASGFRAPNLAELTSNGVHEGSNRYEIGNNNLKSEQNFQTDINLEYRNPHFEFFVNGFYNTVNNYIFISPNGTLIDNNNVFVYTQANAHLYGGEAGIHFHPHPMDWLHITSSFESVTGKQTNNQNIPLVPANKWNTAFKTEFNNTHSLTDTFASIEIEQVFNQNNPSVFETKSVDYTLVNLLFSTKIKWHQTPIQLQINANNVLDKQYIAHLSRLKSDGIPNMGRNIVLSLLFSI
jgi:iron complex outermembrane recepter protein